jgi:GntR family transcriptional regulator
MTNQSVSQKLHESLGRVIAATEPGERLPSEPALSKELGVSRATLREAMRTFETQGLIRRRQGSGTYVTRPSGVIDSGLEVLESIETMSERIGLSVWLGELRVDRRPAKQDEAAALGITSFQEVIAVSRVINAEDRPVAYLIDTLPADVITAQELAEGFTGSVLDLILKRGSPALHYSRTEINAVTAPSDIARLMGIQRGDVLLRFNAHLYATGDRVIDYSYSYFLPGYFRFHVVRRIGKS